MVIKNYINATMPLNSVTVSPNNGLIDSHQSVWGVTFYDVISAMSLCVDGLDKPVNMGILALHTIFLTCEAQGIQWSKKHYLNTQENIYTWYIHSIL